MTMGRTTVRWPAVLAFYFVCIGLLNPIFAEDKLKVEVTAKGTFGETANVVCEVFGNETDFEWKFNQVPVKENDRINITLTREKEHNRDGDEKIKKTISTVTISNATFLDVGNYTCNVGSSGSSQAYLNLSFETTFISITEGPINVNLPESVNVTIECIFEVYDDKTQVKWYQIGGPANVEWKTPVRFSLGSKKVKSTYTKLIQNIDNNGTYVCEIKDPVTSKSHNGTTVIKVFSKPQIILATPIPISTTEVYLNWTVFAYNSNITTYQLMFHTDNSTDGFRYATERPVINIKNTSYLWQGLNKSSYYQVKIKVITNHGNATSKPENFTTLSEDPIFIPNISINGFSATSVTIAWDPPEKEIEKYIHHYILEAYKKNNPTESKREACHHRDEKNLPYMFDDLEPHCTYVFKVKACSDFGGERCGNWSAEMEAATLDGKPSKPVIYHINCTSSYMLIHWHEPEEPKAEIKGYTMELTGTANYIDVHGKPNKITWGPLSKFKTSDSRSARFDDLQPYTRYEVRLSAMTRSRRRGEESNATCTTETAPPDQPPRPRWRKILEKDKYMFKMHLPRVSERNGPICCYRVYMVRLLPNSDWKNLPDPKDISVMDYRGAHAERSKPVAYITDIFSQDYFPSSELVMGDGVSHFNRSENKFHDSCSKCLRKRQVEFVTATPVHTTSTTATPVTVTATMPVLIGEDDVEGVGTEDVEDVFTTPSPPLPLRSRRSFSTSNELSEPDPKEVKPEDGPLEPTSNYTMFVEIIIPGDSPMFSHYVNVLMPAPTPTAPQPPSSLEIALQATCGVAALVLLLMIVVCIRQTRKSRKMPPLAHVELDPIRRAYRKYFGERPQMIPAPPPDMPPIAREDLAAAYAEKQVDSDYGFQKEFEFINMHQFNAERVQKSAKLLQMLPDCYPDRTTHASEARENQPKNRYPDIKAYDQTRVKLSQIDSIMGSDYINANYVNGYQERKRFICAQGPTDTTVNDFWRMIWEHGLELIVMLTNLEEYSKVKCSKYWPDELRGSRAFGSVTVQHVAEKRFSDYIVRELRITKQPITADGQPIVDNNGVAKRNGDCKEAAEGSAPTSPREVKDSESRIVKQYHFLMWKDFAAPEHAYSILKFIKRVNEAWSTMVNRPCVVHCSAGVGRTGTLVALDHLLDQLENEGHAAVFNTVAELRRQRNFLVQSLKQYVFVYRALAEYAHYGDTEIPACRLKSCIDRLRNTPPNATTCLMELEFEKILNNPIAEPVKSCAAGAAEELKGKNRSQEILPYDRNRVILAPIPTREYSTYINASFIEAYDNSEGYIITQDPLPNTIMDFWRMVSEHSVTTIVMLSELGEGKCPRYWDDGTAQYEHISVQYEESESCPYYTRRQFRVSNVKMGSTVSVRQLQYQGWPTAAGAVPEVTRGLAELADVCQPSQRDGSMLVHCCLGTERSSLFVALCILICQLRTERRVDVCSVARKIRSQRARTIDTFLHYEFLHRAILNYAELHNIGDDS